METITATFRNYPEMQQAAAALREQGAIDIYVEPRAAAAYPVEEPSLSQGLMEPSPLENESETAFTLQVLVESSRSRQAEDTIAKHGGQR
ncbi:hypothetical protein [Paenibacillus rigui]|uniref:Uncharacterized protein n=1 Tax=Paenibacillus rigui TaxID=554312 RepID=A0A229UM71_9BACL|nr:hypothetical protein [Paenibacillus rigui]OXM84548.1 hypothetical protein CF651_20120 [Paenibacillus rigui]